MVSPTCAVARSATFLTWIAGWMMSVQCRSVSLTGLSCSSLPVAVTTLQSGSISPALWVGTVMVQV